MIRLGLHKLSLNIEKLKVNPESLLTLKAENLHAVTHLKHPTCLPLQYASDFGSHVLESAKRMARWSSYYFTHPSSYFPVPSSQIDWKDLSRMEPLKSPLMSPEGKELMRKWARDHGKCVKQRTVRQETTKYKAGTLPLNMYQTSDTLQSVGERIVWPSEHDGDQNVNVQEKPTEGNMDQAAYYTESDEEPEE